MNDSTEPFQKCLNERMLIAFEHSILTDVTFHVGPDEKSVEAHRVVLASGSPVFYAMFCGDLAEKGAQPIVIPDLPIEGFLVLLRYIYADTVELDDLAVTAMALCAAEKYLVWPLTKLCRSHLHAHLAPVTALSVLPWVRSINDEALCDLCLRAVDLDFERLSTRKEFFELEADTITTIVSRNSLLSRECTVFAALVSWARAECDARGLDSSCVDNLREAMKGSLTQVRFPLLTIRELTSLVQPTGVLNSDELLTVIQCRTLNRPHPVFSSQSRSIDSRQQRLFARDWWELVMLYDCNELTKHSGTTSLASLHDQYLYGAIDFRVNHKVILGGVRVFNSLHNFAIAGGEGEGEFTSLQPLHLTLYCLAEYQVDMPVCQIQLSTWRRDSKRALIPTLDSFLPEGVVIYPGLWYRAMFQWTSKRPSSSASKPLSVHQEADLQFEFAAPSNRWRRDAFASTSTSSLSSSPRDSPNSSSSCSTSPDKYTESVAPPYCTFLNGFHYIDVSTLHA